RRHDGHSEYSPDDSPQPTPEQQRQHHQEWAEMEASPDQTRLQEAPEYDVDEDHKHHNPHGWHQRIELQDRHEHWWDRRDRHPDVWDKVEHESQSPPEDGKIDVQDEQAQIHQHSSHQAQERLGPQIRLQLARNALQYQGNALCLFLTKSPVQTLGQALLTEQNKDHKEEHQ